MLKNYAIILASGTGSRYGTELPKQFTTINGKTILEHCIANFEKVEKINTIIIVVTPQYVDYAKNIISKNNFNKVQKIIAGGAIRKESSFKGISSIDVNEANVLIHDCARPFISVDAINRCISALETHDAAAVAIPSTDTIIEVQNNVIKNIPQRENLMRVQTPQCFKLSLIKKAHELSLNDTDFTDDCGLIVKHKLSEIFIIEGNRENIKITYPEDIIFAEAFANKN